MLNALLLPSLALATIEKTDNVFMNIVHVVINGLKKLVVIGAFLGLITAFLGPTFGQLQDLDYFQLD